MKKKIKNIDGNIDIIKRNQVEILKLKNTIAEKENFAREIQQ